MGRKMFFDKAMRVDEVCPPTGKKRDRSQDWKPLRNPLLEQMIPMPPSTYRKGRTMLAREATFDPVRGAFVVLARPEAPEPVVGDRKTGLRVGQHKDTGHLKAIMTLEGVQPERFPLAHKRRPPEGTLLDSDLAQGLRLHPLTAKEKTTMWKKYQKALEKSIQRDGDVDGVTWRHRKTKEPAPCPKQHPHRRLFKSTATVPYGHDNGPDDDSAPVLRPPPRSGRRSHGGAREDQVEHLLVWESGEAEEAVSPRPCKMPPSFTDGAHVDAMMDDSRSAKLSAPVNKQRRHVPGKQGKIEETISPIGDRERRALNARDMRELTARGPLPVIRRRRKSH